jgi:HD superfamily phosphohydrolase
MNESCKIIRDPIHGDVKLKGLFLDLIETPELQRLYNIKQLGFANLVFPGANHTRLEHSIGTYHLTLKAAEKLNLKESDKEIIATAALLHDVGHGPFSHTLESLLRESLNVDHVDLTKQLIFGKHSVYDGLEKTLIDPICVFDILNKYKLDLDEIANIISGKTKNKSYKNQLLNSSIDMDQLDYLIRDAYYTGVAYGMIDINRLLQTLSIFKNKLVVMKKGISAFENILMARSLMYSSIYFHKTVRIAELMLSKAIDMIEDKEPFDFFKMTDSEIINYLKKMGSFQQEIAVRLKYRRLFKQAYFISKNMLDEERLKIVKKLENLRFKREKEKEFEDLLKIPKGQIIIDAPIKEIYESEPRILFKDLKILDDGLTKTLDFYTPIAKAIRLRPIPNWIIMIVTNEKHRNVVLKKSERILFS